MWFRIRGSDYQFVLRVLDSCLGNPVFFSLQSLELILFSCCYGYHLDLFIYSDFIIPEVAGTEYLYARLLASVIGSS